MVCVPCIIIPVLLWVFHKFIQPWVMKFWNPSAAKSVEMASISNPPPDVDTNSSEFKYISEKVKANPVMIFSKTTCSYCKMAKDLLNDLKADYLVEEINGRDDCEDLQKMFQKLTGERTVPRVFVGGKCVGGGSDVWNLHNQGKLVPMMKEAGVSVGSDKKSD